MLAVLRQLEINASCSPWPHHCILIAQATHKHTQAATVGIFATVSSSGYTTVVIIVATPQYGAEEEVSVGQSADSKCQMHKTTEKKIDICQCVYCTRDLYIVVHSCDSVFACHSSTCVNRCYRMIDRATACFAAATTAR
jgi:hypothetical protein